jgi:hypothetical protein
MFRKLAGLTAIAGLFIAGSASAAISNSAHDLRSDLFGTDASGALGEICVVCHAPHDNLNADDTLLWNHMATTTTFSTYSSTTLDGTASAPSGVSLLCLGCHDGTIAVDNYGGTTTGTLNIDGAGGDFGDVAAFGASLGNDHPIAITYVGGTGVDDDAELYTAGTSVTLADGSSGSITDKLLGGGNTVECASCHDVHNTVSATTTKLLVKDNTGSEL